MDDSKEILVRIDERQTTILKEVKEIHNEVIKINGRTRSLEDWRILREEIAKTKIGELDLVKETLDELGKDIIHINTERAVTKSKQDTTGYIRGTIVGILVGLLIGLGTVLFSIWFK